MKNIRISLFEIFKYDADCWGIIVLEFGLRYKSLFSLTSDEDGVYLMLLWVKEWKIISH